MSKLARELRLEIAAILLCLVGLILLAGAISFAGSVIITQGMSKKWPETRGIVMGVPELILSLCSMVVPGLALVGAAWGLQRLLRED